MNPCTVVRTNRPCERGNQAIRVFETIDRLITRKRIITYSALLLVSSVFAPAISGALGLYDLASDAYWTDFLAFYTGGLLLNKDRPSDLYDGVAQKAEQTRLGAPEGDLLPYLYPPVYAWLMKPWAALPYPVAFALWRAVSMACYTLVLWLTCKGLHLRLTRDILLVGTAYPPVYFNLLIGQNAIWFLLVYALAFCLMTRKRDLLAGVVLGLGMMKPQLFWLVPLMLIAQRRWKPLAGFSIMGMALALSSLSIVGLEGIREYVAFFNTPFYTLAASMQASKMQSLPQFLTAIFGGRIGQLALAGLVSIPIILLSWNASARDKSPETLFLVSIPGAILGAPQAFNYDLVLLVLPALIIYPRLSKMAGRARVRVVLAALFWAPLLTWVRLQVSVVALLTFFVLILHATSDRPVSPASSALPASRPPQ